MSPRTVRLAQFGLGTLLLLWVAFVAWTIRDGFAMDYGVYRSVGERVLAGGPVYQPYQLAGPYEVRGGWQGDSMYPPASLPLFLGFAALPAPLAMLLWYAVPLGVIGYRLRDVRGWRLVAVLALLAYPPSTGVIWLGNPALWALAALCLGGPWAAFVLVKPTLAPFALVGVRSRWWWAIVAGFAALTLVTLPLTVDWLHAVLNARGTFSGLLYSLPNLPIMLIPFLAGRKEPAPAEAEAGAVPGAGIATSVRGLRARPSGERR